MKEDILEQVVDEYLQHQGWRAGSNTSDWVKCGQGIVTGPLEVSAGREKLISMSIQRIEITFWNAVIETDWFWLWHPDRQGVIDRRNELARQLARMRC